VAAAGRGGGGRRLGRAGSYTPRPPARLISDYHPSEGASKNRTQIPIIHRFYSVVSSPLTGATIGYHPHPAPAGHAAAPALTRASTPAGRGGPRAGGAGARGHRQAGRHACRPASPGRSSHSDAALYLSSVFLYTQYMGGVGLTSTSTPRPRAPRRRTAPGSDEVRRAGRYKSTGPTQNSQVDPAVWLKITIKAFKLAQILGQPPVNLRLGARARGRGGRGGRWLGRAGASGAELAAGRACHFKSAHLH
jgi:hypothetical protein